MPQILRKIKKIANKIIVLSSVLFLLLLFLPVLVQAQNLNLSSIKQSFVVTNLVSLIVSLIKIFFGLIGVIFLIILIYAGFIWMTAGGDPNKIDKAKKIISVALIGLIIDISAFALTSFIINVFGFGNPNVNSNTNPNGCVPENCVIDNCSGMRYCDNQGNLGYCIADNSSCVPSCVPPCVPDVSDDNNVKNPVITYISPAKDIENNNYPVGPDDLPNGAPGNYITIWGRNFGNATGTVIFRKISDNTTTTAPLANCNNTWRNNQIIVEIPSGLDIRDVSYEQISSTTYNYQVAVITASTSVASSRISNFKNFTAKI